MASKIKTYFFLAVAIFFATACRQKQLDPESFFNYYEKNKDEFLKTRETDQLKFVAEYVPTDILATRDMNEIKNEFNKTQFQKNYNNYDSAYYFKFKIEAPDDRTLKNLIKSKENLSKLNQYFMTDIKKDFSIVIGDKTIPCGLVNVESDILMQNSFSFIMSFEKSEYKQALKEDITFVYHDEIFQNGILKFNFSKDKINNFPKIKAN